MSACITAQEYVVWVKGSLNRWLGASLVENGDTAPPYRGWVKEFQALCAVCTRNGDVDEDTQDAMIKANHQHDHYVSWVQQSLNQGLQGSAVAADGTMTPQTIAAIKKFQGANGLKTNGWVGAKTETALRKKGGRKPPVTPAKSRLLLLRPKWGSRTARELAKFWSEQWLLAPLSEPLGTLSPPFNVVGRVLLNRFLTALWRLVYDNEYVPGNEVEGFVYAAAAEGPYGGIEPDQLEWNFKTKRIHDALQTLIKATGDIMAAEH